MILSVAEGAGWAGWWGVMVAGVPNCPEHWNDPGSQVRLRLPVGLQLIRIRNHLFQGCKISHRRRDQSPCVTLIDGLAASGDLDEYHLLHAARADLLRRVGANEEAAVNYDRALALVTNESERRYLQRRLREVQPPLA